MTPDETEEISEPVEYTEIETGTGTDIVIETVGTDNGTRYPSEEASRISVRLEADVEEAFRKSVKENHRSQSAEINYILKKHYEL